MFLAINESGKGSKSLHEATAQKNVQEAPNKMSFAPSNLFVVLHFLKHF